MGNCPTCQTAFRTVRQREGIFYQCDQCGGRAVTLPQIRRTTGDRLASQLTNRISKATDLSHLGCTFCGSQMKLVEIPDPGMFVSACKPCGIVWFEAGKFEALPEGAIDSPEALQMRGAESLGQWKLDELKQRQRAEEGASDAAPEQAWKWIPGLLGIPVHFEDIEVTARPWVTWSLGALMVLISFLAFPDLRSAVDNFGMIPAEMWRYGGLTLITSFFLHAGIWHLLGNLYFLVVFGGRVETTLGHWRFLLLVFAATVLGHIFHSVWDARSLQPCIGASGGISGVLVFYAFKFPGAVLAWFSIRYFRWIHIPAWAWFALWLLIQIIGISLQRAGLSRVSALAHVGGVTAGFLLWLCWRKVGATTVEVEI